MHRLPAQIYLLILKYVYYLTSPKVHLMYMRNTIIHVNVTGLNVFIRINEQCVCVCVCDANIQTSHDLS